MLTDGTWIHLANISAIYQMIINIIFLYLENLIFKVGLKFLRMKTFFYFIEYIFITPLKSHRNAITANWVSYNNIYIPFPHSIHIFLS